MKNKIIKAAGIAAFAALFAVMSAGCSFNTGSTAGNFEDNFQFVPRIHVEDNSFGVMTGNQYRGCSYDTYYDGYWCLKE